MAADDLEHDVEDRLPLSSPRGLELSCDSGDVVGVAVTELLFEVPDGRVVAERGSRVGGVQPSEYESTFRR